MAKAHVRFGQAEQFRPPPYNHFRLNSGPKTYDSLLFSLDLFLIKISSSGGGEPCDPFNGSSWWEETGVHFWLLLQVFDHHNIIRCKIGQETMEMIKINVYCTLCRQYWTDQRLSFNSNVIDELTMNWQVESKTSQSVLLVAVYIQQLDFMSLHCMLNIWKPLVLSCSSFTRFGRQTPIFWMGGTLTCTRLQFPIGENLTISCPMYDSYYEWFLILI